MASYWNYATGGSSSNDKQPIDHTEKKEHPWEDTIRKLDDERYPQEGIAPPSSSSSMPRYPPQHQPSQQRLHHASRGESVRVNYAYNSNGNSNASRQQQQQQQHRRPRVGIFRSSSPQSAMADSESHLDSLELALQDTSRTTSSTVSSAESPHRPSSSSHQQSPQSSSPPKRRINSPEVSEETELAYIQQRQQQQQKALRHKHCAKENYYESIKTGKPPRQQQHQHQQQQHQQQKQQNSQYQRHRRWTPSPNPTNPFGRTPSPRNYDNSQNKNNNPFGRTPSPINYYANINDQNQNHQNQDNKNSFEDEYSYSLSAGIASTGEQQFSRVSSTPTSSYSSSGDNPFRGIAAATATEPPIRQQQQRLRPGESRDAPSFDGTNTTNTSNNSDSNHKEEGNTRALERLGLHILCGEATSQHDIAWRNALYLLGMQPSLAGELDQEGRTALHISCEGHLNATPPGQNGQNGQQQQQQQQHPVAPPCFIIRALLVAHPDAVQHTDQDGRLPLHVLAATSGDVDSLQLLVEAHPESIATRDAMGWTPLHLFLLNPKVHVTVAQTQILLGLTLSISPQQQQYHQEQKEEQKQQQQQMRSRHNPSVTLRQRRGDHLQMGVDDLDRLRLEEPSYPKWEPIQRYMIPEDILNSYPDDVRVCLRRIAQWERKEHRRQQKEEKPRENEGTPEAADQESSSEEAQQQHQTREAKASPFACMGIDSNQEPDINPAAMPTLHDGRLPLHMIIHRGLLDIHLQMSRVGGTQARGSKKRGHGNDDASQNGQHTLIVIVRLLISAHPEGLMAREVNGFTPLLLAMVTESNVLPSQELLEILLGKRTAGYESLPLWAQDTPYPIQHMYTPNSQGLAPAVERYSNPAMVAALDTCQLPLHLAAEDWGDNPLLLLAVYESYPGAIHVQDARGRMPLHVLLENYRQITPHPQVVALLLSEKVARTFTDEGQLPFDLLVASAPFLPSKNNSCNELLSSNGTVVHPDPCKAFQKFFQASILASSTAARTGATDNNFLRRRAEAGVFLVRLRALPPWLRRQACSAPFVQKLLLEELASPSKCAFVLMYGILLTLLLVTFRREMEKFIDTAELVGEIPLSGDSNSTPTMSFFEGQGEILGKVFSEPSVRYNAWNSLAIYGFSAGSIGFQAVFWALSASLGEFQHLCLFSIWRWIDLTAVFTAITTSILIREAVPDDQILFVGTAATGLLWCSLVGFMANWWYEMAFFTGSLLKIARMIIWPLVVAGIFIVGFAEMFYTLAQVDCEKSLGAAPTCSLRHAYKFAYYQITGEPVVEVGSVETLSPGMAALVALFSLLLFLLFLCILVVVIVVASKCDVENVALDAYWEPKLAFVLSSQDSRIPAARHKTGLSVPQPTWVDRMVAKLAELWEVQTGLLFGSKEDRHWYARSSSAWQNCCKMIFSALFLPLWLVAGFATLGFLWPPQVRQYLFRPSSILHGNIRPNEAREFFTSQVAGVRNEVMKMKDMSYEQSNEIHRDIQELRNLLVRALKD